MQGEVKPHPYIAKTTRKGTRQRKLTNMRKRVIFLCSGPRIRMAGTQPEGIKRPDGGLGQQGEPRYSTRIMAINIGILLRNLETSGQRINDMRNHPAVAMETSVTESKRDKVKLKNCPVANAGCWEDREIKGRDGGGVLIYVHHSVPFLHGTGQRKPTRGEPEYCSTERAILVVGAHRPPELKRPPIRNKSNKSNNTAASIAGDLNIDTWNKEYAGRITEEDLRILADLRQPTHRSGTVADAMLLAVRSYVLAGALPGKAEAEKGLEDAGRNPAHVTGKPFIGDYMPLVLDLPTRRPDSGSKRWSYSMHSLAKGEWLEETPTSAKTCATRDLTNSYGSIRREWDLRWYIVSWRPFPAFISKTSSRNNDRPTMNRHRKPSYDPAVSTIKPMSSEP